jgi:hypothetical protein
LQPPPPPPPPPLPPPLSLLLSPLALMLPLPLSLSLSITLALSSTRRTPYPSVAAVREPFQTLRPPTTKSSKRSTAFASFPLLSSHTASSFFLTFS